MPKIKTTQAPVDESGKPSKKRSGMVDRFQYCHNAELVLAGVLNSTVSPDVFHDKCPGAVAAPDGVYLCSCECHAGKRHCLTCGVESTELNEFGHCIDDAGCADRLHHSLLEDPRWQAIQAAKEAAAAARAEEAPERAEKARQRRESTKAPRRCAHCGEATKGGLFVMGHDMKLKGALLRAARDGDVDAMAEFILRGWGKGAKIHKVNETLYAMAEAVGNSGPWLTARTERRLELVDAGMDPEEAVRTQGT